MPWTLVHELQQLKALTEREVEVLRLVARGLSNVEIAGEPYVSETTIPTHVGHMLPSSGSHPVSQSRPRYPPHFEIASTSSKRSYKTQCLNPAHLQGLYRAKLDEGLSPRTVDYLHDLIKQALKQAHRWGLVAHNVAELVDPPCQHRKEMKCLSREQVRVLLKSASGDRLEALYALTVTAGLRQSNNTAISMSAPLSTAGHPLQRTSLGYDMLLLIRLLHRSR